jgi:hypothetical protein
MTRGKATTITHPQFSVPAQKANSSAHHFHIPSHPPSFLPSCLTKFVNSSRYPNSSSVMATKYTWFSSGACQSANVFLRSSSHVAQNPRKKVFKNEYFAPDWFLKRLDRVYTNLQGGGSRLRRYGFHWLFCQANPHPYVSAVHRMLWRTFFNVLYRNNILVYASSFFDWLTCIYVLQTAAAHNLPRLLVLTFIYSLLRLPRC